MRIYADKIIASGSRKVCFGAGSFFLLLFLSADTLCYWNAWILMGLLFVPMLLLGIFLWVKYPELLEKRLHTKEGEAAQKSVIAWSALMFMASFLSAGLDFRYQWTRIPHAVAILAAVVFLIAYAMDTNALQALYKAAFFVLQAKHFCETGEYVNRCAKQADCLAGDDLAVLRQAGDTLEEQTAILLAWASRLIK